MELKKDKIYLNKGKKKEKKNITVWTYSKVGYLNPNELIITLNINEPNITIEK